MSSYTCQLYFHVELFNRRYLKSQKNYKNSAYEWFVEALVLYVHKHCNKPKYAEITKIVHDIKAEVEVYFKCPRNYNRKIYNLIDREFSDLIHRDEPKINKFFFKWFNINPIY